jgi:hypothetical protein
MLSQNKEMVCESMLSRKARSTNDPIEAIGKDLIVWFRKRSFGESLYCNAGYSRLERVPERQRTFRHTEKATRTIVQEVVAWLIIWPEP